MLKRENYGLWVLGALLAILVFIVATSTGSDRSILIKALGHGAYVMVLWLVLLTAVPMWWRSVKKGGRTALTSSAVALPIVAISGWLLLMSQAQMGRNDQHSDPEVKAAAANMERTLAPPNAPKLTMANREDRIRNYANSPTAATGQVGNDQREIKAFLAKVLELRNQWKQAAAQVQWDSILDPARIAADKNMAQSTVMVDAMKQATQEYVNGMHEVVDGLPPTLSAGMSEETKRLMFKSLDLQQQETEQAGQVITFLTETKGRWKVGKQHILFNQQADSDKYNGLLHKIYTTDSQLQSVEAERMELAKKGVDRIHQLSK